MCMRASLENFGIFTFLNCYFFQYFVGTLKISHGLISFGGGGKCPPPPQAPHQYASDTILSLNIANILDCESVINCYRIMTLGTLYLAKASFSFASYKTSLRKGSTLGWGCSVCTKSIRGCTADMVLVGFSAMLVHSWVAKRIHIFNFGKLMGCRSPIFAEFHRVWCTGESQMRPFSPPNRM